MKSLRPIRGVVLFLALLSTSFAAVAQVAVWQGQTNNWTDLVNWASPEGLPAKNLPDDQTHVVFPSSNTQEVWISNDVEIASFTAMAAGQLLLVSDVPREITVNGSFFTNDNSQVSDNLSFRLTGSGFSNPRFSIPDPWEENIEFIELNYQEESTALGNRGSCVFFDLNPDPTSPTCNGFNDGIASVLEPTTGVGPYLYQWVGGPATREWFNVGAGTYTVIVIDLGQGGVACNADVFVNEPGPLSLFSLNGVAPTCATSCDGQASPIVIGGNGGYSLTWSSGETGFNPTALCSTFQLTIEDAQGCTSDTTVTFNNLPDPIVINADVTGITCFGFDDGIIDLTASGGTGMLNFSWSGPNGFMSASEDISSLEPGDYTVEVTDENACLEAETFTIIENPELVLSTTATDNLCNGDLTGAIDLDIVGGLAPYGISWTGPSGFSSTDEDISGLEAGLYEVTVTDAANCIRTVQQDLNQPDVLDAAISVSDLLCFEDASGEIAATASGGTPPYDYAWTGPNSFSSSGPGQTGLEAGTYTLTLTDANLCVFSVDVDVNQPDELTASITETPVSCQGDTDGELDLTVSGGTAPYSFAWSGPNAFSSINEDVAGLEAGSYSIDITDDNGCLLQLTYELTEPLAISLSATVVNPDCASGNSGSIDLTVTNGTPPFIFAWTGPAGFSSSDEDLAGIGAGDYDILVTDANGCTANATYSLIDPAGVDATFTTVNVSCNGGNDGAITTAVSGGTPPYNFLWLGPSGFNSFSQNLSGLSAGTYSLLVSDANGCDSFYSVAITQPSNISISSSITEVTCFGDSDGSILITPSGATAPYSYSWTGPDGFVSSAEDLSGIPAGEYTVVITDDNGCMFTRVYDVDEPGEILIDALVQDVICVGESTGSIDISISGGTPGFNFIWSGPDGFSTTAEDIVNLEAGTYDLEVADAQGCQASASFEVAELFEVSIDLSISDISCFGANDGSIDLTASGGTEPYLFAWTGPNGFSSNLEDVGGLEPGTYNIDVTDANGCAANASVDFIEPVEIVVDLNSTDIDCFGADNGSAEVVASGGTPPLSISWTGPNGFTSAAALITNLEPGEYPVIVEDGSGCSVNDTAFIAEPAELIIATSSVNPDCLVDNGEVSATATGGTVAGDYQYEWTDESGSVLGTTPDLTGLGEGQFTITVQDDNGCTAEETITLVRITYDVAATVSPVSCPEGNDGIIDLIILGGTAPFDISWVGPDGFTSSDEDLQDLLAGDYAVSIEDATGCIFNNVYEVNQPESFVFAPFISSESCPGAGDGSIELNLSGGTPSYDYSWTSVSGYSSTQEDIFALSPDDYTVTVIDANGCSSDTTITLDSALGVVIDFDIANIDCFGGSTGEIDLSLTGGTSPYTVSWSGPDGFISSDPDISGLMAGTYSISVEDINGCQASDSVELTENTEILLAIETTDANCQQADGLAVATATGGTGEITFTWEDAGGTELAQNDSLIDINAGTYTVIATDELGCTLSQTVNISDNNGSISGIITPPTCAGGSDGSIDAEVSGGTLPFVFEWSDGGAIISDQEDLSGLSSGTYTLSVTDANGCLFNESFDIQDPTAIDVSANVGQVSCAGNDGTIEVTVANATEPIDLSWTGPNAFTGSGLSLSGLEGGTYSFVLTDGLGCTVTGDVEVTDAPIAVISETITDLACNGQGAGSIEIAVLEGVGPFDYEWTGPAGFVSDQEDIFNLAGGSYDLLITDALGCAESFVFEVQEPEAITVDFDVTEPDCNQSNGSILANVSGGTVSVEYTFLWEDESGTELSATPEISDVAAGIYSFTATDDNGCTYQESIALSNPGGSIVPTITPETCAGDMNGAIDLEINGVAEPFSVEWTGPNGFFSNLEDLTGLSGGTYIYTITGADGCVFSESLEVPAPDALAVVATIENTCFGESEGAISLLISGGTDPYTISWIGPNGFTSSDEFLEGLSPGNYDLLVQDGAGCSLNDSYEILEGTEISTSITSENLSCFEAGDGSVDLTVSGGVSPLVIAWEGPDGFEESAEDLSGLNAGEYFLSVVDDFGCSVSDSVEITEPEELVVIESITATGCDGEENTGAISLFPEGGTPGYAVTWTGPDGFSSDLFDLTNLEPGEYSYEVLDQGGCSVANTIEIQEVEPLSVELAGTLPDCFGGNNGSLEAITEGGAAPYTFAWTGPDGFISDQNPIQGLMAGIYTVNISDTAGCAIEASFEISQPDSIQISFETTASTCRNSQDGTVETEVSGGTAPYTFAWNGEGFSSEEQNISGLNPGDYTLFVLDDNGCLGSDSVSIEILFEIDADAGVDFSICPSDLPVTLTGEASGGDNFYWTIDGDTLASSADFLLTSDFEGDLSLVLIASNGTCSETDTVDIMIFESPQVDAGPDLTVFIEELFTLGGSPTSPDEVTYAWQPNPNGLFDTESANPTGFLLSDNEFFVTVEDENGCRATDTVFVEVLPELVITSGFTPNGDGTNDLWIIDNIELFPDMVVHVYNRWGVEVFESQGYNTTMAWDGTYNGSVLPSGTYYYAIELNDPRFPDPFTGPLTIHR